MRPDVKKRFRHSLGRYGECLRQNGIKIPAPNTSGTGPVINFKGIHAGSRQLSEAQTKCRPVKRAALNVGVATGSARQTKVSPASRPPVKLVPKAARAFHEFVACMREHGVTNFPEPEGAMFNLSHTHIDTKSPQYRAAETKCNPILSAAL
jgi:hypothetical protein